MAYENNTEIVEFISRAQTYFREETTKLKIAIREGDEAQQKLSRNNAWDIFFFLKAITNPFISATWTETDVIRRMHHYNSKYSLHKFPHIEYLSKTITVVKPIPVVNPEYATTQQLNDEQASRQSADDALQQEIDDINTALANLDFSSVLNAALADYTITANLFLPANGSVLESLTQDMIDDIALNTNHRNDSGIHVTAEQIAAWNAKVESNDSRLSDNRDPNPHSHSIDDISGFAGAITTEISDQISALNLQDGATPVFGDPVVNTLEPGVDADVTVSGTIDDLILTFFIPKGEKGDQGDPFSFDAKGDDDDRFNSAYDVEDETFTFLAEDTGLLYFRSDDPDATIPNGWTAGIPFLGKNGWTAVIKSHIVDSDTILMAVVDWIGGSGDKPDLNTAGYDPEPTNWFIGPNGYTPFVNEATNFKGQIGDNGDPGTFLVSASGNLSARTDYDDEPKGFTFQQLDVNPNVLWQKASNTSADWLGPLPWQGTPGTAFNGEARPDQKETISGDISSNESYAGFTITNKPTSILRVRIFSDVLDIGDGVKTEHCYFSDDDGTTAKLMKNVLVGDKLYLNPVNIGYTVKSGWNVYIQSV